MRDNTSDTPLYLPLSLQAVTRILDAGMQALEGLSIPELCAAIAVQELHSRPGTSNGTVERRLAQFIEAGFEEPAKFESALNTAFVHEAFSQGVELAEGRGIGFLTQDEITERAYLTPFRLWNFEFKSLQRARLEPLRYSVAGCSHNFTRDQSISLIRLFNEDEHLDLQACAGAGKTFLLKSIVERYPSEEILFLTHSSPQAGAFGSLLGANVSHFTVRHFAHRLLGEKNGLFHDPGVRGKDTYVVSQAQIAEWFNLRPAGQFGANRVAALSLQTVRRFCSDDAPTLSLAHLPGACLQLSSSDQQRVLYYAQLMWQAILKPPSPEVLMPIRGYHAVKVASLSDNLSHDPYRFVLVDEAHDMAAPLFQLLEKSDYRVISVGDYMQNLAGKPPKRPGAFIRKQIDDSLRVGSNLNGFLTGLVGANPSERAFAFSGAAGNTTIHYFKPGELPASPTTIICDSFWGVLEWVQRLAHASVTFRLLADDAWRLKKQVADLVRLYKFGERPSRSFELAKYPTWEALEQDQVNAGNESFKQVVVMLDKGYVTSDFEKAISKAATIDPGKPIFQVGTVYDARNHEFPSVMLTAEFNALLGQGSAKATRHLYLSCTRAAHELHLPIQFRDYLHAGI